jgi:glycosyltransferase involved in cell wall biosynthesis
MALLPVFAEDGWMSMDYYGREAERCLAPHFQVERCCPGWQRRFESIPGLGRSGLARNADRLWNRFRNYSRYVRRLPKSFDIYHVCDHSYARIASELPSDRTGVMCHDVDAFRCLIEPTLEPRPKWFRMFASKILRGLQSASVVFAISRQTLDAVRDYGLVPESKLELAYLGVADEFYARPDTPLPAWVPPGRTWLLHVGSCVPRKRIDRLLHVLAGVARHRPDVKLLKIGGIFSAEHNALIDQFNLKSRIVHVRNVSQMDLAAAYRAAPLTLMTSDREGFGLPAIEAIAAGSLVLASNVPALREAGGDAARYVSPDAIDDWVQHAIAALDSPSLWPTESVRRNHAAAFTWARHAEIVARRYARLIHSGAA